MGLAYLRDSSKKSGGKKTAWYQCDCGEEKEIRKSHVDSGATSSCGSCKVERHGLAGTQIYNRWCNMVSRCYLSSSSGYKKYGGRGIGVCKVWRESFRRFVSDMGAPPDGATIGRIDNDWHYEPSNCRWETPKQQANNRRSSHHVTAFGRTQTLQQWADETGLGHTTILYRLRAGWSPEHALTTAPSFHH